RSGPNGRTESGSVSARVERAAGAGTPARLVMQHAAVPKKSGVVTVTPPPRGGLNPSVLQHPANARNARLDGVEACAAGSYTPPVLLTNDDLGGALGVDADWVVRRTGTRERRHAPPAMATSDLCHEAATRCLAAAGVSPHDVDMLIVATVTPDMAVPSTACI